MCNRTLSPAEKGWRRDFPVRGLRAFGEDYPQSQRALLYRGKERLKINGIICLPCEEFLVALHPAEALPI